MNISNTTLPGVLSIIPNTYTDKRGFFHVLWDYRDLNFEPVYQYASQSRMGTLRGLHCQTEPFTQAKLVQVVQGSIFDVVVSLMEFGKFEIFYLTPHQHLFIPPGYAHGYYVANAWADVVYLLNEHYHPEVEQTINVFDEDLNIQWNLRKDIDLLLSEKDQAGISYRDAFSVWEGFRNHV